MTDEHESDLTPAQEAEVRRLLADARHTEPVPDEVVSRLDRVLADLATEPAREATVTRLADRRRRAGTMLVAAAAVVVAGFGISQVVGGMGGADMESAGDAGSAADDDTAAGAPSAEEAAPQLDSGGADYSVRERPYRISSDKFADDAQALRVDGEALTDTTSENQSRDEDYQAGASNNLTRGSRQAVCEVGDWGQGRYFSVLYDGDAGWVVVRPAQGDSQVADLFLCGSESATRSVTLPVR